MCFIVRLPVLLHLHCRVACYHIWWLPHALIWMISFLRRSGTLSFLQWPNHCVFTATTRTQTGTLNQGNFGIYLAQFFQFHFSFVSSTHRKDRGICPNIKQFNMTHRDDSWVCRPRKAAFSVWAHVRSIEQESLGVDEVLTAHVDHNCTWRSPLPLLRPSLAQHTQGIPEALLI